MGEHDTDAGLGLNVRRLLLERGGVVAEQCETVTAYRRSNDLPLLWPIHANSRSVLFELLYLMDIRSATQDHSVLDALTLVKEHRQVRL